MIVEYSLENGLRLVEPLDFRKFKLVLKDGLEFGSPTSKGIVLVDDNHALIPITLVPTLPGRPEGEAWEADYIKMVSSARKVGWVDDKSNAIRAHIERRS